MVLLLTIILLHIERKRLGCHTLKVHGLGIHLPIPPHDTGVPSEVSKDMGLALFYNRIALLKRVGA